MIKEEENTVKATTLANWLKSELEHSISENLRLKSNLDKEREKVHSQISKVEENKAEKIFVKVKERHQEKCELKDKWCLVIESGEFKTRKIVTFEEQDKEVTTSK